MKFLVVVTLALLSRTNSLPFRPFITCPECHTFLQCFLECPWGNYPDIDLYVTLSVERQLSLLLSSSSSGVYKPKSTSSHRRASDEDESVRLRKHTEFAHYRPYKAEQIDNLYLAMLKN